MKSIIIVLIAFISLYCSCSSQNAQQGEGEDTSIFSTMYNSLKTWKNINEQQYQLLKGDIHRCESPTAAAIFEAKSGDGYLYIAHIGWQVAIVLTDVRYRIRDVKVFSAKMGFSTTWRDGLVLTLHRHPGTGMFTDSKVRISTSENTIVLIYDVK